MRKLFLCILLGYFCGIQLTQGASATLIQHVSTFSNYDGGQLGNPYFISLPNVTGRGNTLVLGISYPYAAGRTVAVSDDKSNAWVLGPTTPANPTDGQKVSRLYYALNVAPGTQKITVTFDATLYNFQAVISEFYNVATVAAADGGSGNSASSAPSVNAGSFTTATAGDLIYSYAFNTHPTDSVMSFTAGTGFTLLSADVQFGWVAQYAIQPAAGAINPPVTVAGGTDPFNAVGLALKSASAGSPPSPGIRIVHVCHVFSFRGIPLQFPSTGNLLVCNTAFPPLYINVSAMATTPSNTWVKAPAPQQESAPQIWYAANANTSPDLRLTPTISQPGISLVLYDVTGAAILPYDAAAGDYFGRASQHG